MAEPRFKKFVSEEPKPVKKRRATASGCWRGCLALVVILLLLALAAALAWITPLSSSLAGEYSPPTSRATIEPCSRARHSLHDAHSAQLATYLAWFHRSQHYSAQSVAELDAAGFRPFLFLDEKDQPVVVLDATDAAGARSELFLLAILPSEGTTSGYLERHSIEFSNVLGRSRTESSENSITVSPQTDTSVHGQFLPDSPRFAEEYMCFLAAVWQSAVSGYVALHQRPPGDLDDLLDGLGLAPNPDCAWPFAPRQRLGAAVEGGLIDGKILYWQITLASGARRGQARYWDAYTSFDDPDTPENIMTRTGPSPVADPSQIEGSRRVMFSAEILRGLLEASRPDESPD